MKRRCLAPTSCGSMNAIRRLVLAGCLLGGYAPASAQDDADSLRTEQLVEVEVTAGRLSEAVTSPTPQAAIDGERMRRLGMTFLPDALRLMGGIAVRDYGGIGGMKTVSVRGLGTHHTGLSYDGLPVSNTQAGQIDLSRYQLDNVSSVSMAIGQAAAPLLSARHYAAAGMVSVTTEEPVFTDKPYAIRATIAGGSFGYATTALRYWQRLSERASLSANGSFLRADGDYPFTLRNGRLVTRERRMGSDVAAWQGEANYRQVFADGSRLHAKLMGYNSERGLPGGVILYNPAHHERLWDENYVAQAVYERSLTPSLTAVARMKYDHSWNRYEDVNVKYPGGRQTDINHQSEYYASATVAWRPCPSLSLSLAEDVAYGTLTTNIYEGARPRRWTSLTALSALWATDRLTVDGHLVGTMAQDRRTLTNAGREHIDRHRLSPSLAASWRLLADKPLYLRTMVKHTFRMPSFNDLYYRRFGTVNLRPERAWMADAGLTWSGHVGTRTTVDVTADGYLNRVDDKIVAFPAAYVWRMMNVGRAEIIGADITAHARWTAATPWAVDVTASYALQHAADKTDRQQAYYGQQLPYTPRHSGTLAAVVQTPWLNIGYTMQACGERFSGMIHNADTRIRPYAEHSLTLSRELRLRGIRTDLSASIINITDCQYDIMQYYPMPGRHGQVKILFNF